MSSSGEPSRKRPFMEIDKPSTVLCTVVAMDYKNLFYRVCSACERTLPDNTGSSCSYCNFTNSFNPGSKRLFRVLVSCKMEYEIWMLEGIFGWKNSIAFMNLDVNCNWWFRFAGVNSYGYEDFGGDNVRQGRESVVWLLCWWVFSLCQDSPLCLYAFELMFLHISSNETKSLVDFDVELCSYNGEQGSGGRGIDCNIIKAEEWQCSAPACGISYTDAKWFSAGHPHFEGIVSILTSISLPKKLFCDKKLLCLWTWEWKIIKFCCWVIAEKLCLVLWSSVFMASLCSLMLCKILGLIYKHEDMCIFF